MLSPVQQPFLVHALPGRVRFRVLALKSDGDYGRALSASLEEKPGVREARANPLCGALVISFDERRISLDDIYRWLSEPVHQKGSVKKEQPRTSRGTRLPELIAGAAAAVLALLNAPAALCAALTVVSAFPVAVDAVNHLQKGRVSVEMLDTTAITVMLAQRMPFGAALSAVLIQGGEYIRSLTARRSQSALASLFKSTARYAWVVKGDDKERTPIQNVREGDTVIVYPGEEILVDGIITDGTAAVDQKVLTGESKPVNKSTGDAVYASTLVLDGKLYVRAEQVGEATRASQILQMLEDAPVHDTAIENYASRVADRFVLPALLLGAGIFALTRNPVRAAAVIVFDLATAVRISVPTTVLASMASAVRGNVLIKGGRALERLAAVDTIAFDKTGTLTLGTPKVTAVVPSEPQVDETNLLALAAAAEQRFAHPAAAAIVAAAQDRHVEIPPRDGSSYSIGEGIEADVNGSPVLVGSEAFLGRKNIQVPQQATESADRAAKSGASTVFVASGGKAIGTISYQDVPRKEAQLVISRLRRMGIHVLMITGDTRDVGDAIASELSIDEVQAGVFPERKAEIVRTLQDDGHVVAVIGDGINDSPALAYADVSLSLKGGSDVARQTADIVLHGDLHGLPEAIGIARNAMRIIHQNLAIGGASNLVGIILATFGLINPTMATAINNGSAVVAAFNGLRPLANGYNAYKGTAHE